MNTRQSLYDEVFKRNSDLISFANFCKKVYWYPVGDGKRLRKEGCVYLRKYFPYFEVEVLAGLEKQEIPSKHYIFLARYCKKPYYIGTNKIVFFDEEEAFIFKMCDGNIDSVKDIVPDVNKREKD